MISAAGGCAVGHAANKGRRRYLNFFWSNGAGVEHRISIFSENEGGGPKAIWNFSENSSDLVQPSFPKRGLEIYTCV